jgi:hypothetical protein
MCAGHAQHFLHTRVVRWDTVETFWIKTKIGAKLEFDSCKMVRLVQMVTSRWNVGICVEFLGRDGCDSCKTLLFVQWV